jgi:hypothetical protein
LRLLLSVTVSTGSLRDRPLVPVALSSTDKLHWFVWLLPRESRITGGALLVAVSLLQTNDVISPVFAERDVNHRR